MDYNDEHVKAMLRNVWRSTGYDSELFEDQLEQEMNDRREDEAWRRYRMKKTQRAARQR
jgi:hypothetical protein